MEREDAYPQDAYPQWHPPATCPDVGLFSGRAQRFSAEGDGAGQSAYLMQSKAASIYDAVCVGPAPRRVVLPVVAPDQLSVVLERDGVVVIRQALAPQRVDAWRVRSRELLQHLAPHMSGSPRVCHFDDFQGHAILHSAQRADVWPWDRPLPDLASPSAYAPDPLPQLLAKAARCDLVRKSVGLLPLEPRCPTYGRWHRDSSTLFRWTGDAAGDDEADVKRIPDYCFTSFMPLGRMNGANGAPEFVLGSHRQSVSEARASLRVGVPDCRPGDVILMNGKTLHRGTPNPSAFPRDLVYVVWSASWFDEEVA